MLGIPRLTDIGPLVKKKDGYMCECIDCGHIETYSEHCRDVSCPECGGEMRREERPGPGY